MKFWWWVGNSYNLHFEWTCYLCDINKSQIESEDNVQKYVMKRTKNIAQSLIGENLRPKFESTQSTIATLYKIFIILRVLYNCSYFRFYSIRSRKVYLAILTYITEWVADWIACKTHQDLVVTHLSGHRADRYLTRKILI